MGPGSESGFGSSLLGELSPVFFNRPLLNGSGFSNSNGSKAQNMGIRAGLRQGLRSRDASPSNYKRPIFSTKIVGQKEKAIHIGEEYELSEDLAQKHGCDHTNRYDDNLYSQSPPIPFSVFGHPLLPGGFSGLVGMFKDKDLEPLKVVAADGREWGWERYGALSIGGRSLVKSAKERRRHKMSHQRLGHMRIGKAVVWLNSVNS